MALARSTLTGKKAECVYAGEAIDMWWGLVDISLLMALVFPLNCIKLVN